MMIRIRIPHALLVAALLAPSAGAFAQSAPGAISGGMAASDAAPVTASKSADRKLARRVLTALARTRGLNAARIFVKARSGRITLSGSVSDNGQIQPAVDAATHVDGVESVENFIHVAGPSL